MCRAVSAILYWQNGWSELAAMQKIYEISSEPKLIKENYDAVTADMIRMMEDGYVQIGYSNFEYQSTDLTEAVVQAKKFMPLP